MQLFSISVLQNEQKAILRGPEAQIFTPKATGLSNEAIGKKVGGLTSQGVGHILKTYRPNDLAVRPRSGRPPKVSKRYLKIPPVAILHYYLIARYIRQLLALNYKKPFWSAATLVNKLHETTMAALLNRPSGAVIRVWE